ncbi:MAG: UDP-N-acetylglucosamine diphosphorylase/glucosamine-1-phosphate N-acetyltransferase [Gammaproteobacteria bacterium]|nr:UDP-N-acetylglucosamine diphosphorylase/glucosamine-1-phosphate N-acetyltransferase [Gammaproteobacteria bacterium]
MFSDLPKVLHPLGGRPLVAHVVDTALNVGAGNTVVVYGHGGELVRERLPQLPVQWVEQAQQLGTGHAVAQAMPEVADGDIVLILYGDVPLIRPDTLKNLLGLAGPDRLALLTVELDNPSGYGRIVRDVNANVAAIVEEKDAEQDQLSICEINTGIMAVPASRLRDWLSSLNNNNAQGEYYLTDVIGMAVGEGLTVQAVHPDAFDEVVGVNNRCQLAELERSYQRIQAEKLMLAGVTLADPGRIDIRGVVTAGRDVFIDVNVILEGRVVLGDGVTIGANNLIRDSSLGSGCEVLANCVIEEAIIGDGGRVGPFARVRPETRLAERVHVGNFVEIKKSWVGKGSKINHLSYIGDSEVGQEVNIGAGTITCNYDGAYKHKTVIGDRAFIGSDTQLVAPVTVGDGATLGAGSTITRDVPPEALAVSRVPQKNRQGWKRPVKKTK